MSDQVATCRHCGQTLRGKPYYTGGSAYLPLPKGGRAPVNYYGGFVCSRSCDYRTSLELEQSMPGHNGQQRLGDQALARVNSNWPEEFA